MKRLCLILFVLGILTASSVSASCRRVIHRAAVVVEPGLVAAFVPLYSVGYAPQGTSPEVEAELKSLREQVEKLKAEQPQVLPQKATPPKHVSILKTNCARCHSGAAAKGGLTMFESGKLLALTAEQRLKVVKRITLPDADPKRMPKGGKSLSEEDSSEIVLGLVAQK